MADPKNLTIKEIKKGIEEKIFSVSELVADYFTFIKKEDKKIGAF